MMFKWRRRNCGHHGPVDPNKGSKGWWFLHSSCRVIPAEAHEPHVTWRWIADESAPLMRNGWFRLEGCRAARAAGWTQPGCWCVTRLLVLEAATPTKSSWNWNKSWNRCGPTGTPCRMCGKWCHHWLAQQTFSDTLSSIYWIFDTNSTKWYNSK